MIRRIIVAAITAVACLSITTIKAEAAQPALSITPSIYQLDLSKAGAQPTYTLTIRNLSDAATTLEASSLDITGQNAAGATIFSPPGTDTNHDIGASMRYEPTSFELAPGAAQVVKVTIDQPESLEPGGHYGAAVFTVGGNGLSGTVGVKQAVSSLLFVTTSQGGIRKIGQPTFTFPKFSWKLPASTDVIIPNAGNTQVAPSGSLQIVRHGKLVADGAVNPDSNLILAGQDRLFRVPIRVFSGVQLAGRYQVDLRLKATPDSPDQRYTSELVYISPWFIALLLTLITATLAISRFIARRRLHKRLTN